MGVHVVNVARSWQIPRRYIGESLDDVWQAITVQIVSVCLDV